MVTPLFLGYDVGTSSVKVGIVDADGTVLAAASAGYAVARPAAGHVEQAADDYVRATFAAIRQAVATVPAAAGRVHAIGCCGQAPSLVLVGNDGRPVRPAIVWQDTRASQEATALAAGGAVDASSPVARVQWLARHEPAVLARARTLLGPKDFVTLALTGERVVDAWTSRGFFVQLPVPGQTLPAVHPALPPTLVPRVCFAHEVAGGVTPAASAATGLPAGTTVAAGWSDGMAACLGSGALAAAGLGLDIAGTSDMIGLCAPGRPGQTRVLTAPVPGSPLWTVFGPTQCSGGAVEWLAGVLGCTAAEVLALAADAPAGADGLTFLPYLEGERAPIWDPRARGLFFGLTTRHGSAHLARAVLEGVAYSVRHVLETAEGDADLQASEVRLTGGGSRAILWNQIRADICNRPFRTVATSEGGVLGAAMLGAVAAGFFPDLATAADRMVKTSACYLPDDATGPVYDAGYQRYRELSERLAGLA